MYYWRRRLPNALASWFHKRHLFLSLQTPDPNFARRPVVLLDAKLEEVVTAFENAEMHLTPPQVDGLLRSRHSLIAPIGIDNQKKARSEILWFSMARSISSRC
jgi:hypothetical protein